MSSVNRRLLNTQFEPPINLTPYQKLPSIETIFAPNNLNLIVHRLHSFAKATTMTLCANFEENFYFITIVQAT